MHCCWNIPVLVIINWRTYSRRRSRISISYDATFEAFLSRGCIHGIKIEYRTKNNYEVKEEELNEGKEKEPFKVVEDNILANLAVYAKIIVKPVENSNKSWSLVWNV